MINFV